MSLINIKAIEAEALKEISQEKADKAKKALVAKLRQLEAARQVVRNMEHEVADLKESIADGSFVG
jgi:anti-sigma28 factor (negative regulator of flagellin synthesis)